MFNMAANKDILSNMEWQKVNLVILSDSRWKNNKLSADYTTTTTSYRCNLNSNIIRSFLSVKHISLLARFIPVSGQTTFIKVAIDIILLLLIIMNWILIAQVNGCRMVFTLVACKSCVYGAICHNKSFRHINRYVFCLFALAESE